MSTTVEHRPRGKKERLEARLSAKLKAELQQAAELEDLSLTAFVLRSARRAAKRTFRKHHVLVLSPRDSAAFAEAQLHPGPASPTLQETVARFNDEVHAEF